MTAFINRACALALACSIATPTFAADYDFAVPIELPTGSVINLVVAKHTEQQAAGQTQKMDGTFRYTQKLTSTEDGYSVEQTMTGFDLPPEAASALAGSLEAIKVLNFETDDALAPVRVLKLNEIMDRALKAAITAMGPDVTPEKAKMAAEVVTRLYGSMTPEDAAAAVLKEQAFLSLPQMAGLDLGKRKGGVFEEPSPFGPGTLRRTTTMELKSIDKKAKTAAVETLDEIDPNSFKALLPSLFARIAPGLPQPPAEELAKLRIEQKTTCQFNMDLVTGLTARADCSVILSSIDEDGKPTRKLDRYIITQTLAKR